MTTGTLVQPNGFQDTKKFVFESSVAFRNGAWVPCHSIHWSVTDIATTHGVMLVERLRTAGGNLFDCLHHVDRLKTSAELIGLQCNSLFESIETLIQELVRHNQSLIQEYGDVGIVVLLSPGDPGHDRSVLPSPTLMMHLTPIPYSQLSKWYRFGCGLHISETRNVPSACWSPWIKTRSRLHYYLADNPPRKRDSISSPPTSSGTVAVLLSVEGLVTETSVSNLLLLDKTGRLISPAKKDILQGVSLFAVERIAKEIGIPVHYEDLRAADFDNAVEILMTGTTGFIWAATEFEGHAVGDGVPGDLCKTLQNSWAEKVGFSFVDQAIQRATE